MTVASQVKQSLASLKSIYASFQQFSLTSTDEKVKRVFHEAMLLTEEMIADVKHRLSQLEREEPQYHGK
ncbi:DUF1657 domain-containing protein [Anoxybacteroides amylolyticum]|uniref:DUF1657 domain-containing protein n=1 Tax=Anoxybacteroides amylolyticum TaxID=294699 RepID=A0A167T7H8_9BACL|nr:DUF1657 domain-containing protein [Anoxybacillus amylolyticus]ANB59576.1 hypothetical protein GFC30_1190 [Anoxybacillus amylolyticus]